MHGILLREDVRTVLSKLVEVGDTATYNHCLRVGRGVVGMLVSVGASAAEIETGGLGATIHDCGKYVRAIQEVIHSPKKKTTTNAHEFDVVKDHVSIGVVMAQQAGFDGKVQQIVGGHHMFKSEPYGAFPDHPHPNPQQFDGWLPGALDLTQVTSAIDVVDAVYDSMRTYEKDSAEKALSDLAVPDAYKRWAQENARHRE